MNKSELYIARDENGGIYIYEERPQRKVTCFDIASGVCSTWFSEIDKSLSHRLIGYDLGVMEMVKVEVTVVEGQTTPTSSIAISTAQESSEKKRRHK